MPTSSKSKTTSKNMTIRNSKNGNRNNITKKNRYNLDKRQYVALDCEMVGAGRLNLLAEVAIVDWDGNVLYHDYVKPKMNITDYRTQFSGVTKEILDTKGKNYWTVRENVLRILQNKIVIGHDLTNDLRSLRIEMPQEQIRNTAKIRGLMSLNKYGRLQPQKLSRLAEIHLNSLIQKNTHNPIEDAITAMEIFKKFRELWNNSKKNGNIRPIGPVMEKPIRLK